MRLGQAAMEALKAEITGCLQPGDELVVACPVALKGTSVIAENKKDILAERFSAGFIRNCISLWEEYGAQKEVEDQTVPNEQDTDQIETGSAQREKKSIVWNIAQEAGASALYDMGEGGFLSALWKMAEASEVGLEADFRKVPVRQETIEVCEIFDLNPYKLQAEGSVLIGIREAKLWCRNFEMQALWQRLSVRQIMVMTGFCTAAAVPVTWNVLLKMRYTVY